MNIRRAFRKGLVTTAVAALATVALGGTAYADGPFREIKTHYGKCLDVRGEDGVYTIYAHIQQYHCTGAGEQQWSLTLRNRDGLGRALYSIKSKRSGFCIIVEGASTLPGALIRQAPCSTTWDLNNTTAGAELWYPQVVDSYNHYYVINYRSGQALDVAGSSSDDHALIIQNTCARASSQQMTLQPDAGFIPGSLFVC